MTSNTVCVQAPCFCYQDKQKNKECIWDVELSIRNLSVLVTNVLVLVSLLEKNCDM